MIDTEFEISHAIEDNSSCSDGSRTTTDSNESRHVVVTMTSWTARIGNVLPIIRSVMENTMQPDRLYLNLSESEFEGIALPKDLTDYFSSDDRLVINWVPGENTKTMKKVFPILKYLQDDDIIINIDDDAILPKGFIESRYSEFISKNEPITSCNNPQWHYIDESMKIWSCGAGSVFQKKMLNGWDLFMDDTLIHSYNDDWCYTTIMWINGYRMIPCSSYFMQNGGIDYDGTKLIKFNEIDPLGKRRMYALNDEMHALISKRIMMLYGCSLAMAFGVAKRPIKLVIFDSVMKADDNGEHLYDYIRNNRKDIELTFLISRRSPDFERLTAAGYNTIPFEDGVEVCAAMENASLIIFSKDVGSVIGKVIQKYRDKSVFLQHGVVNPMNNVGWYFRKYIAPITKYICCSSENEAAIIAQTSGFDGFEFLLTGLCRWDSLITKNSTRVPSRKNILVSFHWRNNEIDKDEIAFAKSKYLAKINGLLNHNGIKQLCKNGNCDVTFMCHPHFKKYEKYFKVPSYIKIADGSNFQDTLVNCDALVTDFSSNAYEASVIGKPVLYYIPDEDYVARNMPQYDVKAFDEHAVGKLHHSIYDLIYSMKRVARGAYTNTKACTENIKDAVKLNDGKCCKRMMERIIHILAPKEKKNTVVYSTSKQIAMVRGKDGWCLQRIQPKTESE